MATNISRRNIRGYAVGQPITSLAPEPIVAQRAPTTNDFAEIGTTWVDVPSDAVYVLTSISANSATWSTSPASGVGSFTAVTVNPGDLTMTAGDIIVAAGDIDVQTGSVDIAGDLTVAGTFTFTGDLDLTSAALIDLTSTLNGAPSIYLHANGGTSEQILLRSDQGTGVASISLLSDVGGITLDSAGLASDDAINITAQAGGVDIDAVLQLNMASAEAAADAVVITASSGGMDITSAGAFDMDITSAGGLNMISTSDSAGAVSLFANGGTSETIEITSLQGTGADSVSITSVAGGVFIQGALDNANCVMIEADAGTSETIYIHSDQGTGAASINIESDVGGITLTSGLASADAINLNASAGGVDIDGALQVNIASAQNAASALVLAASAGGIDMTAAGAAGEDIDILCTAGSVNITAGEAIASAITIQASDAAGGIDISAGTGDLDLLSTGNINITSSLDGANAILIEADAGTSETIYIHADQGTGVESINLESDVGGITLTSGLASTDAINLEATAGGLDVNAALEINIASSEASVADAITISASAADGGITLDAGATPGVTVTNGTQSFQILTGSGSPNGSVTAAQGSLYVDVGGSTSTTILFVNTDGSTTWLGVGA